VSRRVSRRAKSSTYDLVWKLPITTASNVDAGRLRLIVLDFNRPSARKRAAHATPIGRPPTRLAGQLAGGVARELLE
jgi:hypothetical protein